VTLLLDTTVVIDLLRDRPVGLRLRRLRAEGGRPPYICAVVAEEVERGLRPEERARAAKVLAGFRVAPLGLMEGRVAGAWRREYAARGVTLGQGDCLIAAAAHGVRARLATGNPKHFPMEGLVIEHWPVGE
jgi:predicted nucleic acid-binding protein